MNSAALVAKKMRDMSIKDEDILTSKAFGSYMETLLSIPCKAIRRRVPKVNMQAPEDEPQALGCTDGRVIYLNPLHPIITHLETRTLKTRMLIGVLTHEFGHYRFTDTAGSHAAISAICENKWFPVLPEELDDDCTIAVEEVKEYISENPDRLGNVTKLWHDIYNILEDCYIEECLYRVMSGILIDGLNTVRAYQRDTMMPLKDILEGLASGKFLMYDAVTALLLGYGKFGTLKCDTKNPEERDSEPVEWINKARRYVDQILYASSTKRRLLGVHLTFLTLWPIVKEKLLSMPVDDDSSMDSEASGDMRSSSKDTSGEGTSPRPVAVSKDEDTGSSGSRKSRSELSEDLFGDSSSSDKDKDESDADGTDDGSSEDADPGDSTAGKHSDKPDDTSTEEGEVELPADEGASTFSEVEESFSDEEISSVMYRIERDMKEEKAVSEVNDELTKELGKESSELDYGAAHRGLSTSVSRVKNVSERAISTYNETMGSIEKIAEIMARRVKPYLRKNDGDNAMDMTGFFSGSKFDATRLVYNDYRVFKHATTPLPDNKIAVSILIDESASMGGKRIEMARAAAIALYSFCEKCELACSVIGHTSKFGVGDLELSIYADFDTPDKLDKYRLLNIQAKQDNRDGAAILFAGEHLLKRPEKTKILFIISDGAPCATRYHGRAAEADMANIANGLSRRGAKIFTAAIGSDKENIHRIFGTGFLDITSLETLPEQMLALVKRYIR